jgi:hypothetical protein
MVNLLNQYFQIFLGIFVLAYAGARTWGFFFTGSEGFSESLLGFIGNLLLVNVALVILAAVEKQSKSKATNGR